MTEAEIKTKLDTLSEYQAHRDLLEADKRKFLDEVKIPAEVEAEAKEPNAISKEENMRAISEITINGKPLQEILDDHKKWVTSVEGGTRAYLTRAYLTGAYLTGADLTGADLSGAYLMRADLSGAIGVYQFGPIGAGGRIGYAVASADGPMFALGCHWGNLTDTRKAIVAKYGKNSLYEKQAVLAGKIVMEVKK
jgi:hypothetical protein